MTAITNLSEALHISKDSIASRPLIDLPGSTKLVLFAMDKDQEISAHSAPFPARVICLEGKLEVVVDGTWKTLSGKESIDLPAKIPHGIKALSPSHWLLLMLRA